MEILAWVGIIALVALAVKLAHDFSEWVKATNKKLKKLDENGEIERELESIKKVFRKERSSGFFTFDSIFGPSNKIEEHEERLKKLEAKLFPEAKKK